MSRLDRGSAAVVGILCIQYSWFVVGFHMTNNWGGQGGTGSTRRNRDNIIRRPLTTLALFINLSWENIVLTAYTVVPMTCFVCEQVLQALVQVEKEGVHAVRQEVRGGLPGDRRRAPAHQEVRPGRARHRPHTGTACSGVYLHTSVLRHGRIHTGWEGLLTPGHV